MRIEDYALSYQKPWAANANTSSFASRIPTVTEPTNDGVMNLVSGGGVIVPQKMLILPYGLGSDDDAYDMKVVGWKHIGPGFPQSTPLWVPTTLGEFTCTLGSAAGIAGAPVLNTELFVDTIVLKSQALTPLQPGYNATPALQYTSQITIFSPADNTLAWILLPLLGMEKVEFLFDQTTNTPTMNCLVALL